MSDIEKFREAVKDLEECAADFGYVTEHEYNNHPANRPKYLLAKNSLDEVRTNILLLYSEQSEQLAKFQHDLEAEYEANDPLRLEISRLKESLAEQSERLKEYQETNTRLNRRCQDYEAGIVEKIKTARELGDSRTLGRALANAGYAKAETDITDLEAKVAAQSHELERLREERNAFAEESEQLRNEKEGK